MAEDTTATIAVPEPKPKPEPEAAPPKEALTEDLLSPLQKGIVDRVSGQIGIGPAQPAVKPAAAEEPPPGTVIPSWDQIKGSDTFKNASDDDRRGMLNNWYNLQQSNINQNAPSPEERDEAIKHLDQFMQHESVASLERYGALNFPMDIAHGAISGTARLAQEAVTTVAPGIAKPFRKLEKYTEKNVLAPDAAWEQEHPFFHTIADAIGNAAPFIAGTMAAEAITGGAATPVVGAATAARIGKVAAWATDATMQLVDTFQSTKQRALAKIDERRKNGETISAADGDRMANDDASMALNGVPFMTFSNMMISRIAGHGMDLNTAKGFWNQFNKNVLQPGIKEFAGQVGIGTGVNALNALADQYSGVDKTGITPDVLKQGAWMGVGYGVMGAAMRGGKFGMEWTGAQNAVNKLTDGASAIAEARMRRDPGLSTKDAHEQAVNLFPPKLRDGIRAKLAQREAAKTLTDSAISSDAAKSPQTSTELSKQAGEAEKESTVAPPTPPTPPTPTPGAEEAVRQYPEDIEQRIIKEMLANGHITQEQHDQLMGEVEADPGTTMGKLTDMVREHAPQALPQVEADLFDLRKHAHSTGPLFEGEKREPLSDEQEQQRQAEQDQKLLEEQAAKAQQVKPAPGTVDALHQDIQDAVTAGRITPSVGADIVQTLRTDPTKAAQQLSDAQGGKLVRAPTVSAETAPVTGAAPTPAVEAAPAEAAPAPPATEADQHAALKEKVTDYLGFDPSKTGLTNEEKGHRQDLADEFWAQINAANPSEGPIAAQLMHRLKLDPKRFMGQRGEHPTWAAHTEQQRRDMLGKFNQFLTDKTAAEGRLREKARPPTAISKEDFFRMADDNDARGLHDLIMGGQSLTIPADELEPGSAHDRFLSDNDFHVDLVGDNYVIGGMRDTPGAYELMQQKLTEAKIKRGRGRPAQQVYSPAQVQPEYSAKTDTMEKHPAEEALMTRDRQIAERIGAKHGAEGADVQLAAEANYRRELRRYAKRMRDAGRSEDLQLVAKRENIKARMLAAEGADKVVLRNELATLDREIAEKNALRITKDQEGKEIREPSMLQIAQSRERDFLDWKEAKERAIGEQVQLAEDRGEGEEGGPRLTAQQQIELAETGRVLGDVADEEHEAGTVIHPEAEETAGTIGGIGAEQHQALAEEFVKGLRTTREKQAAWHVAEQLAEQELKKPPHIKELPRTFGVMPGERDRLLNRITNEYIRFIASKQPRPAREGGAPGAATRAAAARGISVPSSHPTEIPPSGEPGHAPAGEQGDTTASIQSSAHVGADQGAVAPGEPTGGGRRETVAGLPGPTTESKSGTPGTEAQLLPAPGNADERAAGSGAPGAGRVRRDAATGERIIVTAEGAERGSYRAPRITPQEEQLFKATIRRQIHQTTDAIWNEWKTTGHSSRGEHLGLFKEDYPNRMALANGIQDIIAGVVKQEPTLEGRLRLANDALRGTVPLKGEMSASQLRRARETAKQTTPVTTVEQVRRILNQSWDKYANVFAKMGIDRRPARGRPDQTDSLEPWPDGTLHYIHSPTWWDKLPQQIQGLTEGQLRNAVESMMEEELIHAAHLAWYRDEWVRARGEGYQGHFKEYIADKGDQLINGFAEAREAAKAKGDDQRVRELDKMFASSVKSYFSDIPGARDVNSFDDYNRWVNKLDTDDADRVRFGLPYELARQMVQLNIFGRTTEREVMGLFGQLHDWFMRSLNYLRQLGLRTREGDLGQVWKDTITTLEKRVNDLRDKIGSGPPETAKVQLHEQSHELASKLGEHFLEHPDEAESYGLRFDDATHGPDNASKIMAKVTRLHETPERINEFLNYVAQREGLIDPPKQEGQALHMGRMGSLASGISDSHVLDEGETDRLARYFRMSPDPEMREFAKSLVPHRERLKGVNIRQLKHEVPAAFYHNGDLWITEAALQHPSGQKAIANELQHAIAQEILASPNTGTEHEIGAHALAITDEFKRSLPANIRDAVDNKFPDIFNRLNTDGSIDWDHVNDEERIWLPLIQAASDPSEFVKKAFASANFRDYLRSLKSDRGDPLWDNVHDWGRTVFGDQAFKFAPEAHEIAYNRPGVVMREDPRTVRRVPLEFELEDIAAFTARPPKITPTDLGIAIRQAIGRRDRGEITRAEYYTRLRELNKTRLGEENIHPGDMDYYEARNALDMYKGGLINIDEFRDWASPGAEDRIEDMWLNKVITDDDYINRLERLENGKLEPTDLEAPVRPPSATAPTTKAEIAEILEKIHTRQRINKYDLEKGPIAIMDKIGQLSSSTTYAGLAKHYAEVLRKNPGIKVTLDKAIGHGGFYALHDDEIVVNAASSMPDSMFEYVLVHEMTHAITSGKIAAYLTGRFDLLSPGDKAAIQSLEAIRRAAIAHHTIPDEVRALANLPSYNARRDAYVKASKADPSFKRYYGLIDLHEMASEALTNGAFQKVLNKVPYETKKSLPNTALGKFFHWLSNFLGFKEGYGMDAALKNMAKLADGEERLIRSNFKLDDTTGTKTAVMRRREMEADFLDTKAKMEGYEGYWDVPKEKLINWIDGYRDQQSFIYSPDTDKPQVIAAPVRRALVHPSDELSRKSEPSDILDHVARVTGIAHHDARGLARAIDQAFFDGALSHHQYLAVQDALKEIGYANLSKFQMTGDPNDPNSPRRRVLAWFKNFTKEGQLPKAIHQLILKHINDEANALGFKLRKYQDKLNNLIKKHLGDDPSHLPAPTNELMNKALAGDFTVSLPPEIIAHLREGRTMIDDFTDRLRAAGLIIPGSDLEKIMYDNRGKYVARSYRMFNEPRFIESPESKGLLADAISPYRDWWINLQTAEAANKASRRYRPGTVKYAKARQLAAAAAKQRLQETVTHAMAERDLIDRLYRYRQMAEVKQLPGKVAFAPGFAMNDSLLQELTQLPEKVREMMGEEKDVRKNFSNTIWRQSNFLQNGLLAQEILKAGNGKYFGDHADPEKGFTHPINPASSRLGALSGKWTSKEISDVLNGYDHIQSMVQGIGINVPILGPIFRFLESNTRYMTTILSIRRGVGNMHAALFGMIQNGMLPTDLRTMQEAKAYILGHMLEGSDKEMLGHIEEAMRYGILDKTGDPYLIRDLIRNGYKYMQRSPMDFMEGLEDYVTRKYLSVPGTKIKIPIGPEIQRSVAKTRDLFQKFHTAGNDISKMAQWVAKQKFVREANAEDVRLGRPDDMTGEIRTLTDDEVKRKAANIVRDTNISYSLASPFLKQARRVQFIGTFLTFFNEMARSYANQWKYALEYTFRSPNQVEKAEGVRRLVGLLTSAGLAVAIQQASMRIFGVSPREDNNLRKMLAPWEQYNARVYGPLDKDGNRTYINLNYVLPQGDIARALIAAMTPNKDGLAGRIFAPVMELTHPMWNMGLMAGALVDWSRNQTEYGTQVYNPEDHFMRYYGGWHPEGQAWDVGAYLWNRLFGGTIGRAGRQLKNIGTVSKGGTVYDPNLLVSLGKEWSGLDIHTVSIPARFASTLFSSKDQLGNAQRIFDGPVQRNVMTDQEMKATYQHMEDVRRVVFSNLHDKIEAARDSGMSTTQIRTALKARRYSTQMIQDLMSGKYHPYIPGKGVLQEARKKGNHMPSGLFSRSARAETEEEQ